jgi:hypothetical protein
LPQAPTLKTTVGLLKHFMYIFCLISRCVVGTRSNPKSNSWLAQTFDKIFFIILIYRCCFFAQAGILKVTVGLLVNF